MENNIYERDYNEEFIESGELAVSTYAAHIMEETRNYGIIDTLKKKIQGMPHIIIPQDKVNFEYLLPRLDAFAKKMGGYIRAEINYQRWESTFDLILPFLEFMSESDYELFKDITTKTDCFTVTATEDGNIRVHIIIDYFEELGMDAQQRQEFFSSELENHPDLKKLIDEYQIETLRLELEPITGVPGEQMNEDMLWFVNYSSKLDPAELDVLMAEHFSDCYGDSFRLLQRVKELRARIDGV